MVGMFDTFSDGDIPIELIVLRHPFPHFVNALSGDTVVRVVAMGSSSTAGRGDVVPYPHWLEMYLRVEYAQRRYPNPRSMWSTGAKAVKKRSRN
jgi:hypothetical protein